MKTSDFDYKLPVELIAKCPEEKRDSSRLLVLNKQSGKIDLRHFGDILDYLKPGDLLVLNNSKVFPARLIGQKNTGGTIEILLNRQIDSNNWECIGKRLKNGSEISFGDSKLIGVVKEKKDELYIISFNLSGNDFFNELEKIGEIPLPPYIKKRRDEEKFNYSYDKERYQTVYAKDKGSSAAPTAGLHFTPLLLEKLKSRGVVVKELTLHVGLGTFQPVKVDNPMQHKMHKEFFVLPKETLKELLLAKSENRRIIAVGTTTTRVLEHAFKEFNFTLENLKEQKDIIGTTEIFIYPGFEFKCIDGLITNFHLPKSTLLMLVSALAGRENILKAYNEAVLQKMRFFSYGDAMLIT